MTQQPVVAIIGAGPAGLMAADVLSQYPVQIHIYDAMPSAGRKFLMAGKGGMNISHSEAWPQFLTRYAERRADLQPFLDAFDAQALRAWLDELGIATFVGSSGRVFPTDMKAAPLLRGWLHRLRSRGVVLHMRHRWTGWQDQRLSFTHQDQPLLIDADAVLLALGGGSWPQLGSDGAWQNLLSERGIAIQPLQPSNCGFDVAWSDYFRQQFAGQPLKSVGLRLAEKGHAELPSVGELMVSEHGLEGGLLYAWSAVLREHLTAHGQVQILIDLLPQRSLSYLLERLNTPRGKDSISNWLRKRLGLSGVKLAVLREALGNLNQHDAQQLAQTIKALPISLQAPRPLAEAISSAGGVSFDALDGNLMLNSLPGVFCAGEMLDWEAPTGGYLLTACFATGRAAGLGVVRRLGLTKDCHQLMQ